MAEGVDFPPTKRTPLKQAQAKLAELDNSQAGGTLSEESVKQALTTAETMESLKSAIENAERFGLKDKVAITAAQTRLKTMVVKALTAAKTEQELSAAIAHAEGVTLNPTDKAKVPNAKKKLAEMQAASAKS